MRSLPPPVGPQAGVAAPSATLLSAAPSATVLATAPTVSSTDGDEVPFSSLQVRRVYVKGSQQADLTLPDGDARVVIENRIGPSVVRLGGHYSFYDGRIEAWVTYGQPLWPSGPLVQVAASDRVGLGQLYYRQRSLERAREIPIAVGHQFTFGSVLLGGSRTSWLLAPLDAPANAEKGLIDAVDLQFTTTNVIPDIAERLAFLQPDTTAVEYKRAFRSLGADFGFERVSADLRHYLPGLHGHDETLLRIYAGQAYNVRSNIDTGNPTATTLPIRETFALGGASALKGYQPGEFRGNGILAGGVEYAALLPLDFSIQRIRLDVWQSAVLVFAEEGRIQDRWGEARVLHGDAMKWSTGVGLRFKGKLLNSHKSVIRLYMAQAGEFRTRRPVYYALADVADW